MCDMPIYLRISRLNRCVTIVAHGDLGWEEIADACRQVIDADGPHFAKLIDTTASTSGVRRTEMEQIVQSLRASWPEDQCGPVAFLIDLDRPGLAVFYAEAEDKRRVRLFTSLHQARDWLLRTLRTGWRDAPDVGDGNVPDLSQAPDTPMRLQWKA